MSFPPNPPSEPPSPPAGEEPWPDLPGKPALPGSPVDAVRDDGERQGRRFVAILRGAGLLGEMGEEELGRILATLGGLGGDPSRIALLDAYYSGGGDLAVASRRAQADRFFVHREGELATASSLVQRLGALSPEIGPIHLERIGDTDEGPLVVRSPESLAPVVDDEDDLYMDEERPSEGEHVSVRALVHAINNLLGHMGTEERLVALHCDHQQEAYVAVSMAAALELCNADILEFQDPEELKEHACW